MAYAVTHVLGAIVALDLLRHYVFGKKKFPRYLIVIGGIAGLLPDIDIPLSWVYNALTGAQVNLHGVFTHSIVFPIGFIFIALLLRGYKKGKWSRIGYVVAAGWCMHLFLDWMYGGVKGFFWPLMINGYVPAWNLYAYAVEIDAVLLVLWIVHEEVHGYVKDYF